MTALKYAKYAAAWEGGWWLWRKMERTRVFNLAQAKATELGRPLVVVGAPDLGPTEGPGCGDITVDLAAGSQCPNFLRADISKPLPMADDSVVVFVSCVLEYVDDFPAAVAELRRVAGPWLYNVRVEPWTFVFIGIGYAACKRSIPWANGLVPPDAALSGFGRMLGRGRR